MQCGFCFRSVLYEGINVVTNYCKKLSVGDQLTGKIVRMGATRALVNIDGGVKHLWLPFKEISGVPMDAIAAEKYIKYDTPVIVEVISGDEPSSEQVNDTVKLIAANGKKVYKYDNNAVAKISQGYINKEKKMEMRSATENLQHVRGGWVCGCGGRW